MMDAFEQAKLNSEITIEPIRSSAIKQEAIDNHDEGHSSVDGVVSEGMPKLDPSITGRI